MSKYKSMHGLNYVVNDELYFKLQGDTIAFRYFDNSVEMAELIPNFLLLVTYFICLFVFNLAFWYTAVICLVIFILAYPFSMLSSIYKIKPLLCCFQLFEIVTKFLVDIIAVIIITIFVFHNWIYMLIYMVIRIIFTVVLSMIYGYEKRSKLHNKIAMNLLKI